MKPQYTILLSALIVSTLGCSAYQSVDEPTTTTSAKTFSLDPSADLVRAHMAYLASDALEGREAGTSGYDKAAAYVAEQFKMLGLIPGGNNDSYFQEVPLRASYRDAQKVSLEVTDQSGLVLSLQESSDYLVGGSVRNATSDVSAPVVFAGYGLVAPELGRDDYAGLEVEGKLVALLSGTPSGIQSEERAYYGSRKSVEASKRGALGIVSLYTPVREKIYAFGRIVPEGRMDSARMGWVQKDGQVYSVAPNLKVSGVFSLEGAEKIFANAPVPWTTIIEAAEKDGGQTPTFDMGLSMTIKQGSNMSESRSENVLGIIPGSDPELKHQALVLSAHLDGLGISKTDAEDKINNGALDNAAGVATLIETARMLMNLKQRPRRTVVFLANTAEEKGLLGAQYFVKNSTLKDHEIVGNVNLDMPVLTYDFQDVVVFGGDRSSFKGAIRSAAQEMGLVLAPDPFPEQGIFTRSDHFRFVESGIPAVMLATGMANGGEKAWAEHFAKNYHTPSDDMDNNINFAAAAKFAELKTRITLQVANTDQRPLWNKGDFFARQFNGPMSKN